MIPNLVLIVSGLQRLERDSMTESFCARMPTQDEIEQRQRSGGEPVVVLTRKTFTRDGRIVQFARGVNAASRFTWSYTFKIRLRNSRCPPT
jgi:GntR family transcriptional regulator